MSAAVSQHESRSIFTMSIAEPPPQSLVKPEIKFVADARHSDFAWRWLKHHCLPDPAYRTGIVRSVYYDTPQLDAYAEKVNGDFYKQKVRLRWYDPDTGTDPLRRTTFLEVKNKAGGGRNKDRVKIMLDRDWLEHAPLSDARFLNVLRTGAPGLLEATLPTLFPSLVVQYSRQRYVCPATHARVCLDTDISVERVNTRLLATHGYANIRDIVIEIKDSSIADIPWIESLYTAGFRQRSFSKYGNCIACVTGDEP